METIIASNPNADTIDFVMDNLNIHGPKSLTDHFGKEKGTELWNRLTVHYTLNTPQLAQSGRNRDQSFRLAMRWVEKNPDSRHPAPGSRGLEC
jgi:hypothetical protein